MNSKTLFSVEQFENSNRYIVTYPDGTCDTMTLEEVRRNFDIPVTGGEGHHGDYETALASLAEAEDDVPGDFFSKSSLPAIGRGEKKRGRQFSADDPSLI